MILTHQPGSSTIEDYSRVIKMIDDKTATEVMEGKNPMILAKKFPTGLREAFFDYYYYCNRLGWRQWIKKYKLMFNEGWLKSQHG